MDYSENEQFLNKLPICNSETFYVCNSNWKSNKITIEIIDYSPEVEAREWKGMISTNDIKQSANELEIPYEDFYQECKQAITMNKGLSTFSYSIENQKFVLRKVEKFKITYLEINLNPVENLSKQLLFESVDTIISSKQKMSEMQLDIQNRNLEYETVITALEDCVQSKNELEQNLFAKFLILLNSKKDKIAEMQQFLNKKNTIITEMKKKLQNDYDENEKKSDPLPDTINKNQNNSESENSEGNDDFVYSQPTQVIPEDDSIFLLKRPKFDSIKSIAENVHATICKDIPTTSKNDNITEIMSDNSEKMFENM